MRENGLKQIYKTIDSGNAEEKLKRLPSFPKIIEFEITNHCNFQCIMCPTGTGQAKRPRGYMSDEVFGKVIDEVSEYNVALKFVGQGEPLLHPKAVKYIIEAHEKGIITHLTTNGSLLTEEMCSLLVKEQALDSIKFSFQGIDAKGYKLLRRKDNYEDLMKKIASLYDLRGNAEKPYITIGTSVTNESKDEIDSFINIANQICDRVEVGKTQLESSDLSTVKDTVDRNQLLMLQEEQMKNRKRYVCCPQVFDVITVRWNGDICACCGDVNGEMTLGNISDLSIADCWNGQREKAYRQILAEGRYEDIGPCKECYDIYGWTYGEN